MNEITRGENTAYSKYEELIIRRDAFLKEAFQYHRAYVREFGDAILQVFQKKIECIRKKKTIEYCQAALNHGKTVNGDMLQAFLAEEMAEFQKQLKDMMEEQEEVSKGTVIPEKELLEIKRIYHRLVKKIHPDINPGVSRSSVLMDLWNRVVICYNCNDLKGVRELEVLVKKALEEQGCDDTDLEIDDVYQKIEELEAEIKKICETDPYQYKYLLEDPELVAAKKEDLVKELKSYIEYSEKLDKVLAEVMGKGVTLTWQMNW